MQGSELGGDRTGGEAVGRSDRPREDTPAPLTWGAAGASEETRVQPGSEGTAQKEKLRDTET